MKQRLDVLVVKQGLAESRHQAATLIMAGQVTVNNTLITKAGSPTPTDAVIALTPSPRYVGRGGLKLEGAAAEFKLNFKGKTVLDVGASTGGFTDYALQQGAAKVYAVDVGTGQLHWKLRQDSRVIVMEKTDIRKLAPAQVPEGVDMALVDVSFISLKLVLPAIIPLLKPVSGEVLAMAKPQFEAARATASKHRGVIKNDTIRRQILQELESWLKEGFIIEAKADSAVSGAKGNIERFYLLKPIPKK